MKRNSLFLLLKWLVAWMLLGVTAWYFVAYDAYEPIGEELFENAHFEREFEGWKRTGVSTVTKDKQGVVTLSVIEPKRNVQLFQWLVLPPNLPFLQLSVQAATHHLVPGKKEWQLGRLFLVFYDKNGKKITIQSEPFSVGSTPWHFYKGVFEVPEHAHKIRVGVNILQATGVVQVNELSLLPVRLKAETMWLTTLGFVLWLGMIIVWMWPYFRALKKVSSSLFVFMGLFIAAMMMPGGVRDQIAIHLPALSYSVTPLLSINIESMAHLLLFFSMAFLFIKWRVKPIGWVILDLLFLGMFIEALQIFVEGRSADLSDLWVDYFGLLFGALCAWLWCMFRNCSK